MALKETLRKVNYGGGLEFLKDREKGDFEKLIGQEVTIDEIAFVTSRFYDETENVLFTVVGDKKHYYRTGSAVVVQNLKDVQEALDEEGLDWDILSITFAKVRSNNGRIYYAVNARDAREEAV
jgi:hypothetical protein